MTFEERVLRLEKREVWHWAAHAGCAVAAIAACLSLFFHTASADTLRAHRFVLLGAHGGTRALLAGDRSDHASLELFDNGGASRVKLGLGGLGEMPYMQFFDAQERAVVRLAVNANGPRLTLGNAGGKAAIVVHADVDGTSGVEVYDDSGDDRLWIGAGRVGLSGLVVSNTDMLAHVPEARSISLGFSSQDHKRGRLRCATNDGRTVWAVPER